MKSNCIAPPPTFAFNIAHAYYATTQIAFFTHTMCTKANSIQFAHQALCSPCISTLLQAIRRGYLKGCPNLSAKGVMKYHNPSPASAKGHMKCPRHGIQSTCRHNVIPSPKALPITITNKEIVQDIFNDVLDQQHLSQINANVIKDNDSPMNANLFCFATFVDKHTGTIYNGFTGAFPFMSLEGNVCFLVVYHYKTNAMLALPVLGFSNEVIMMAYKQQYELLESKGFNIILNIMDNQASAIIKKYLTIKIVTKCWLSPIITK
jgi:hypothetical protein